METGFIREGQKFSLAYISTLNLRVLAHSNVRPLFSVNLTTEMWHPVSWNSTSRIDNAWGEFPRSGYSLTIPHGLETTLHHMWFAVITLLVYCYCGCCLMETVCGCCCSTMPKRISAKKKLQLAEATKRRKLLYTSSTQLLLRFISTKHITKYRENIILCLHNKTYFVIIHQIIELQ